MVAGQRFIRGTPDIFLGWGELDGIHFYIRQLRDMKGGVEFDPAKVKIENFPQYSSLFRLLSFFLFLNCHHRVLRPKKQGIARNRRRSHANPAYLVFCQQFVGRTSLNHVNNPRFR